MQVPPLAHSLPEGTVHLQYPGLGPICRQLGFDFAPALVGFEPQAGRMLPKLDGVVVCTVGGGLGGRGGSTSCPEHVTSGCTARIPFFCHYPLHASSL